MQNRTKIILALIGTTIIGGIAGFVIGRKTESKEDWNMTVITDDSPVPDQKPIMSVTPRVESPIPEKPDLEEYVRRLNAYSTYSETPSKSNEDVDVVGDNGRDIDPYIISADDFAKLDDYDDVTLTYYQDDVLADEMDHKMSPIEIISAIGNGTLDKLGDEDDALYVRNPRLKIDYEILTDMRTYEDVVLAEKPYIRDEERYREELEEE